MRNLNKAYLGTAQVNKAGEGIPNSPSHGMLIPTPMKNKNYEKKIKKKLAT